MKKKLNSPFVLSILAVALLFTVGVATMKHKVDKSTSGQISVVSSYDAAIEGVLTSPVKPESKEAYKLDDAEYKGAVATKFSQAGVSGFGFVGVAVMAWLLFGSFFKDFKKRFSKFLTPQNLTSLALFALAAIYFIQTGDESGYALAAVPVAVQIKGLKEEKSNKVKEMDALILTSETEKRDFKPEEQTKYDTLKKDVEGLNARIGRLDEVLKRELEEAGQSGAHIAPTTFETNETSEKDKKDLRNFSMVKVVRSQAPNHFPNAKLDGLELEMHQEAIKEARSNGGEVKGIGVPALVLRSWGQRPERRDMTAGTGNQGGFFIQTDVSNEVIDPLRARLVCAQAGARYLSQLQGNLDIPKNGGVSVAWAAENATAAESTPTIGRVQLTPKRLAGFSDLSVLLIKQSSPDVERMVREDYLNALAVAIDLAAIAGPGTGGAPTGILSTAGIGSVVGGTNGAAPTQVHITSLEEEVAVDNADLGALAYITNPKVRRKLKNTAIETGDSMRVWDRLDPSRPLNGYPALITNNIPSSLTKGSASGICSAILYGNFNDLLIGMWGGMDVQSNPYTKLKEGQIEVVAAVYADVAVRRAESFAAMLDALTT